MFQLQHRWIVRVAASIAIVFAFATTLLSISHDRSGLPRWVNLSGIHRSASASHVSGEMRVYHPDRPPNAANVSALTLSKTIVMAARVDNDVTWLKTELPQWNHAVYLIDVTDVEFEATFDHNSFHRLPHNKGNEGNAYLWHIIQNYDNLTDIVAFMHAHRQGWHVDNEAKSNPQTLQQLDLVAVLRQGYTNLRCDTKPACPDGLWVAWDMAEDEMPDETATVELLPGALKALFPLGVDTTDSNILMTNDQHKVVRYPERIAAPCCAQFAVSREQVLQRPRSDYERYHRWLMEVPLADSGSGRVMEYLWHIIFGRQAIWCPNEAQCRCDLFKLDCPR